VGSQEPYHRAIAACYSPPPRPAAGGEPPRRAARPAEPPTAPEEPEPSRRVCNAPTALLGAVSGELAQVRRLPGTDHRTRVASTAAGRLRDVPGRSPLAVPASLIVTLQRRVQDRCARVDLQSHWNFAANHSRLARQVTRNGEQLARD
jgi:hypothetical protein